MLSPNDAQPGDRLLVDDGKIAVVVEDMDGQDVVCTVTERGPVSNNNGLSMPGMNVSVPALSEKDIEDLEFALQLGVDLVALAFVRSPADIELVHEVMDRVDRRVPVIAK
jgi:pyruvate kinase